MATVFACALAGLVAAAAPASAAATATPVPDPDAFTCDKATSIGFEDFAEDTDLSSTAFDGVDFTTTGGYTWRVIDFGTGYYNGKYPNGAYTSQGTHAAWLGVDQGSGRISFTRRASTVSLLVSSYTPITMEAYDAAGTLLEATPFSRSNIRTGQMDLLKITRSRADIASVVVHDSGNYFIVDSLCTDAGVDTPGTDLAVTMSDGIDPVAVGSEETFTIDVTNNGPLDTDVVDLSDAVPAGFAVTSAVPSQGVCPSSGNNVVCNLGTLAAGEAASVIVTATAANAGTWTNTASVGSDAADAEPTNNAASTSTTVSGTPSCTVTGTTRNDTLDGTTGDDVICGLAGNDTIRSSGGVDVIVGGLGSDTLSYVDDPGPVTVDMLSSSGSTASGTQELIGVENVVGSAGDDRIGGDDFTNTIDGGAGADSIFAHAGNDTVRGGGGDDQLFGGSGSNGLDGGPGTDTLRYGSVSGPVSADLRVGTATSTISLDDTFENVENLSGSKYDDRLGGDDGPNVIEGGQGDDLIFTGGGDDQASGASGSDAIYSGTGTNDLDGGPGFDTVSYGAVTVPVRASLVLQNGVGAGLLDQLSGFENLTGSPQADLLTGDTNRNLLKGGLGNDVLSGKGGNDDINGGAGLDQASFSGATLSVTVNLTTGRATGEGTDTLVGIDSILGGPQGDDLTGSSGPNTIAGGTGNDRIDGQGGDDSLQGGGGGDSLFGGLGRDTLDGGPGIDALDGGSNVDACTQGPGGGTTVNCED